MLIYETSMIVDTQKETEEIILLLEDEFKVDRGGLKGGKKNTAYLLFLCNSCNMQPVCRSDALQRTGPFA